MHLTEEMADTSRPRSAAERLKCIIAREKYLLNLPVEKTKYSKDVMRAGASFLAVLAFCDSSEPLDSSLLSDDTGSSSGANNPSTPNDRGTKRSASERTSKPLKKARRSHSAIIPPKTQVACLTEPNGSPQWVLGSISRYVHETKKYEVFDDADDGEVYCITRKNIRIIPKKPQNFEPKQRVLAVYPATTVFYPASLVKRSGKYWMVEFDDEDVNSTRIKEVEGQYVMLE